MYCPHIAGLLAEGLKQRLTQTEKPLTIIACENMIGGSAFLKEKVYEKLTEEEKHNLTKLFQFSECSSRSHRSKRSK